MLKKIFFTAFSLFLMYRTYDLLVQLWPLELPTDSHLDFLLVAFLINLFATGIFAFLGFVYPTSRLIGSTYYTVKHPKQLESLYGLLGVRYFKKALLFLYWGHPKQRRKYFDGTRAGVENLIYQANQSEFGHLAAFVLIGISSLALLFRGHWEIFIYTTALNVVGNGYPILVQRHHRLRVARLGQRQRI